MSLLSPLSVEKPREIAARVLKGRLQGGAYTEVLLDAALAHVTLSPADRRLCQELAYGVVRRQATLDWLIARKTPGRAQKPMLRILLQLGLYQMFWLDRIPDHAAVNETVGLAREFGLGQQAGFVNAVLRGYGREAAATKRMLADLKTADPPAGHSIPPWLWERWKARWGLESAARLMDWNNTPPPTFARINTLKTNAAALAARWPEEAVQFTPQSFDWTDPELVFRLDSHPPLSALKSFQEGLFYVQDPSTLLAVAELNLSPGATVLDLCAAPGGKTTFIAQRMENRGLIVAEDNEAGRLELVRENCARLGVTCVEAAVSGSGGSRERQFDQILVDAPCSNTGVMRRRVDLRWRLQPGEIERLRTGQLELLRRAALRLKPGGVLVYSTCSLEPEENSSVVQQFLGEYPAFKLERERELLPFQDGVDGAYIAKLVSPRTTDY
jgi:16S rRNA (cytosine967-C5)-methyltransferase